MSEPFIGEIRFFSFQFSPKSWAFCDGRQLPISQYQALFSLIGTTFGGNGTTTFALPDLRGRVAMHPNGNTPQGASGGLENVTLLSDQLPTHNHMVPASSTTGTLKAYEQSVFAAASGTDTKLYATPGSLQTLIPTMISATGGSQPHENCQPSAVGNYCIALMGLFPSRN